MDDFILLLMCLGYVGGLVSFFVCAALFANWVEDLIKGFIQRKKTQKK